MLDIRGFFPEEYTTRSLERIWFYRSVKRIENEKSYGFVVLTGKSPRNFIKARKNGFDKFGRPVEAPSVALTRNDLLMPKKLTAKRFDKNESGRSVFLFMSPVRRLVDDSGSLFFARASARSTFTMILWRRAMRKQSPNSYLKNGLSEKDFPSEKFCRQKCLTTLRAADVAILLKVLFKKTIFTDKIAEYLASGLPI